jgi:diguanylate cyclase (GGDEF)-like protein
MSSSTLRVLVSSGDRSLLRQFSLMLEQFGYDAVCCADLPNALAAATLSGWDFLIVDHDLLQGEYQQLSYAKRRRDNQHLHVMLLCSDVADVDLDEAIEAGVDDFLKKPPACGEVLARLRAGARYCEFQRRTSRQQWHDPLTGLSSQSALIGQLSRELPDAGRSRRLALVLLDLDFFASVNAQTGVQVGNEVLSTVARLIGQSAGAGHVAARLKGNRFAVLLPDHSVEKGAKWAEQLRQSIDELTFANIDPLIGLTASFGVAGNSDNDLAHDVLRRAEAALADAKRSGRNCLVCYGQFDEQKRQWHDELHSGNPFRTTLASDVMTPFALTLRPTDTVADALALFAQSKLEWLAVLDDRSRLVGMVERSKITCIESVSPRAAQTLEAFMSRDIALLDQDASFAAVMDKFVREEVPVLAVTSGTRPVGYIGHEQFLALVRPVSADMFADDESFSGNTEYLVVPDVALA